MPPRAITTRLLTHILFLLCGIAIGSSSARLRKVTDQPMSYVTFSAMAENEEIVSGLPVEAEVRIKGTTVGKVVSINRETKGHIRVDLRLPEYIYNLLGNEWVLHTKKEFGINGKLYLDLRVLPDTSGIETERKTILRIKGYTDANKRAKEVLDALTKDVTDSTSDARR